jgi:hypothetical protein
MWATPHRSRNTSTGFLNPGTFSFPWIDETVALALSSSESTEDCAPQTNFAATVKKTNTQTACGTDLFFIALTAGKAAEFLVARSWLGRDLGTGA